MARCYKQIIKVKIQKKRGKTLHKQPACRLLQGPVGTTTGAVELIALYGVIIY